MRLSLITLLCLMSVICHAQRKLSFEKVASMPNEAYAFAYASSDHDLFAFAGGDDASRFSNILQIYDTRIDLWLDFKLKALPYINRSSILYMEDYHSLILVGGVQKDGFNTVLVEKIRMLDLDDFSVKEMGPIPAPARKLGLAKEGNKVYMFGGSTKGGPDFTCSNKLFRYDLDQGHLQMLPDMPVAMETGGAIVDGNLYVFGGYNGKALAEVWKYNIGERKWSALAPLPKPTSSYALAQYGQYLLLVGDHANPNQLIVYDTKNQSAEYFKTGFRARNMGAAVTGEYLYVYGGIAPETGYRVQDNVYRIKLQELISKLEQ